MTTRLAAFRAREQAILQAAEALLLELGDESITIEMIAERVGIAKGTIYKHFQSKDELILQLLIAYEAGLAEEMHRAIATGEVTQVVQAYFTYRLSSPEKHLLYERLETGWLPRAAPCDRISRVCISSAKAICARPCRWCRCS